MPLKSFLSDKRLWWIMVVLVFADRMILLFRFAFRYTDHDQTLMWFGTREMIKGRFHEPHFYGQDYNSLFEAFLAVPLVRAGLDFNIALPVITSLLSLLPFLLISKYALSRWRPLTASLILLIPLLMRPEYGMITSLSRGFVTGLGVASVAFWISYTFRSKAAAVSVGFFTAFALWLNPNAAPFILCFLIITGIFEKKLTWLAGGLAIFAPFWYWSAQFYKVNSDYLVTKSLNLSWDLSNYKVVLSNWPDNFGHMSLLDGGLGIFIFAAIAILMIHFWIVRDNRVFIALLVSLCLMLLGMGFGKALDGYPIVFYPLGRIWLALPLLLALGLSMLSVRERFRRFIFIAGLVGFALHFMQYNYVIEKEVSKATAELKGLMYIEEIDQLRKDCQQIKKNAVGKSLVVMDWNDLVKVYGCPCLTDDFPETWLPAGDRRSWMDQQKELVKNVWFQGSGFDNLQTPRSGDMEVGAYLKEEGYLVR